MLRGTLTIMGALAIIFMDIGANIIRMGSAINKDEDYDLCNDDRNTK